MKSNTSKSNNQMTNYNERLDEILRQYAKRVENIPFGKTYGWSNEKQALTSLIKELVAEAKPDLKEVGKQIPGDMDSFLHNQEAIWSEQYVTEFEQNLLKALEEV